jgi:hypothetical protein
MTGAQGEMKLSSGGTAAHRHLGQKAQRAAARAANFCAPMGDSIVGGLLAGGASRGCPCDHCEDSFTHLVVWSLDQ